MMFGKFPMSVEDEVPRFVKQPIEVTGGPDPLVSAMSQTNGPTAAELGASTALFSDNVAVITLDLLHKY